LRKESCGKKHRAEEVQITNW